MSKPSLKYSWLTASLLSAAISCAYAGVLQQVGPPLSKPSALGTYGMHVPANTVLSSLVPKGWHVKVLPGASLTEKISWQPQDTWISVLSRLATNSDTRFELNWNTNTLLVIPLQPVGMERTTASALVHKKEAHAKRFIRAHVWHPRHHAVVRKEITQVKQPILQAVSPGIALPAPKVSQVHYHITLPPQPSAGPARSFYAQSAKHVLEALATHYHLRLEWHGGDFRLPGPVTLLFDGHLREDIALLQTALGPYDPLKVVYYAQSRELVVRHALSPQYFAFAHRPLPPPPPESDWQKFISLFGAGHHVHATETHSPVVSASVPVLASSAARPVGPALVASAPAPVAMPAKTKPMPRALNPVAAPAPAAPVSLAAVAAPKRCTTVTLLIAANTRLSVSLKDFLEAHHLALAWKTPYDLRSRGAGHVTGGSVAAVLKQVLSAVGLRYSMNTATHTVTVSSAQGATSAPNVE